ncbi:hypothetical protein GGX14DRAFT_366489 [Mycena pura]|uniref:Reverse transcriptase domain-containing protein n=1 Tax=Mycena pura TaxID=153505 RepID=A0AAD6Y8K5_9AGAR|nr:hypothetical protein GGX14DRAFT_366489 [Mycena pura]
MLWNIYFADLADVFESDSDDITLNGRPVSHLEQADDVVLFSTTAAGLQRKLNQFFGWCRVNFMVISIMKTVWMIFGNLPRAIPVMLVGDCAIELVKSYKYVGLIFTSVNRDIFAGHYTNKASKARVVANTTFAVKSMIGCLPPAEGIQLYMARVDPHLTFGCEVTLDVVAAHLKELTDVQHEFIRRLLGVHSHSILSVLFTETGIIPLCYRRPILALGYLGYLLTLPSSHFANTAYLDSCLLAAAGYPSWISDLRWVVASLPVPVELRADLLIDTVSVQKALKGACEKWMAGLTTQYSSRIPLIQGRLERNEEGELVQMPLKLRQYLRVPVPAHRKALTRLYLSAHRLGIEVLRYAERYRERTPRNWRLCRFCRCAVESESHALLGCMAKPELAGLRTDFLREVYDLVPNFPRIWESVDAFLLALVQCRNFDVTQRLAKLAFDVFAVYAACEVFKPAEYLYTALE